MTKNTYSVPEYEAVRATALALIEARIRHNLKVQEFLDTLLSFTKTGSEARKIVRDNFPDRYEALRTYEERIEQIMSLSLEGTNMVDYIPALIDDLRSMVEEDITDF